MPNNFFIQSAWCSKCLAFTWHVHRTDDRYDCLYCRSIGEENITGLEPIFGVDTPSLDSEFISARRLKS